MHGCQVAWDVEPDVSIGFGQQLSGLGSSLDISSYAIGQLVKYDSYFFCIAAETVSASPTGVVGYALVAVVQL